MQLAVTWKATLALFEVCNGFICFINSDDTVQIKAEGEELFLYTINSHSYYFFSSPVFTELLTSARKPEEAALHRRARSPG